MRIPITCKVESNFIVDLIQNKLSNIIKRDYCKCNMWTHTYNCGQTKCSRHISASTAALAAAIPNATLCIKFKPAQIEAKASHQPSNHQPLWATRSQLMLGKYTTKRWESLSKSVVPNQCGWELDVTIL